MVATREENTLIVSQNNSHIKFWLEVSVDFPDLIVGGGLKPSPSQESLKSYSSGSPISRKDLSPNNEISYVDKIGRESVLR